jgi:hypothetical protein
VILVYIVRLKPALTIVFLLGAATFTAWTATAMA